MIRSRRSAASRRFGWAQGAVFICGLCVAAAMAVALCGCGEGAGDDGARPAAEGPAKGEGSARLESLPGAIFDPPRPAPALRLTDADGRSYDLAGERGHVTLVYFGFTECPDVCPSTLRRWAEVHAALGADSSRARFVFVSIDPDHDTPAMAAAYARMFDPTFVGLSGTDAEIRQIALAWNVATGRTHSSQVFVVNPDGLIPWGYGRSASVEEIVRGIRTVEGTPESP